MCIEGSCEMQVVPITSTDIKERIHQTYRMGYIKDVILPRVSVTPSCSIHSSGVFMFLADSTSGFLSILFGTVGLSSRGFWA